MKAKETKKQHFVPRTYLKKFSVQRKTNEHQIYVAHKSNLDHIFPSNIEKICRNIDLYTLPGEKPEQRMLIEKFYSETYENNYNKVYEILTNDKCRNISKSENELIIATLISMYFRTTKMISEYNDYMARICEDIVQVCKQTNKESFIFHGDEINLNDRTAEELARDFKRENRVPQIIAQLDLAMTLIEKRKGDAIQVIKIKKNGPEYITSDNPVIMSNIISNRIVPFDRTNMISLTLNNSYKVIIHPMTSLGYISRLHQNDFMSYSETLTEGYLQLMNSERFVLGSKNGLTEFRKIKERTDNLPDISNKQKLEIEEIKKELKELGFI